MKNLQQTQRNIGYSLIFGVLAGVTMAIIFAAGFFMRDIVGSNTAFAAPLSQGGQAGYPLLDEVQTLLDNHYLRQQPDRTAREYAAIRGMMASLEDRYTFFVEPPVAQSESDVLAGTYGGVGVQIYRNENGDFVLYPYPDSPAENAGVEEGDILLAIDGETLDTSTQQDVVDQKMRGEVKEGNGVELGILKSGDDEVLTVFIAFDVINVPSVIWRVLTEDEEIGYVQILRFTSRTPQELKDALGSLLAEDITALVLDMRNNSGGLLRESIDVASEFLDKDQIVLRESRRGSEESFQASGDGLAIEIPLVVLVNQGTASAAELVAGAIQDHDRGILIGQTTYGKGTVQQIFRLSDDSSLHITSAEWLTPNGNTLDGIGLQPDIAMIPDPNGRDVELGEAVRELQELK